MDQIERTFYRDLAELQRRMCGICAMTGRLVLDHDHATGMVRGYLCSGCNTREARHDQCDAPWRCPICRWRLRPATSYLGYTFRYEESYGPRPQQDPFGEFLPMEVLLGHNAELGGEAGFHLKVRQEFGVLTQLRPDDPARTGCA